MKKKRNRMKKKYCGTKYSDNMINISETNLVRKNIASVVIICIFYR